MAPKLRNELDQIERKKMYLGITPSLFGLESRAFDSWCMKSRGAAELRGPGERKPQSYRFGQRSVLQSIVDRIPVIFTNKRRTG